MDAYIEEIRKLENKFSGLEIHHVDRDNNVGDLVLRTIQDETGLHKLNSRWEGPFIVTKVIRPGSYRITDTDGNEVLNS